LERYPSIARQDREQNGKARSEAIPVRAPAYRGRETDLVKACLEYLDAIGVYAWRNNSGALPVGKRFLRFGKVGSSDILGVWPKTGTFLAIECKVGKNVLTMEQLAFQERVNAEGGFAFAVWSLDDLEDALNPRAAEKGAGKC